MRSVCLIFLLVLSAACGQDQCRDTNLENVVISPVSIERSERELFNCGNQEQVKAFLEKSPVISNGFLHSSQYPDLNILAERLFQLINDPYIDTLYKESNNAFDQEQFEAVMGEGLSHLSAYFPQTKVPRIQTMVTGFYNDLYISKDDLIIGLDYFIGENASYRPNDIPQYILRRYSHQYLASTVLKFISNSYVINGNENTLLSEMIDHGKVIYLLSRLMPCTPDHIIMGFTEQELIDSKANQEIIWSSFLENEVLYTTDEFMKVKFLGERPNVYEIGEKCPGRIGAWVGWQIVESYMARWELPMDELMQRTNHHELFAQSGYKPKNEK